MEPAALPYVLLTGFFFGTSLVAARFGIGQFVPQDFTSLRLVLASLCFLGVYFFDRGRTTWPSDGRLWRHALLLGIFGVSIPLYGTVLALQYLSSGLTAIFITIGPAVTVLLAHFFLAGERLSWRKGAGVGLALLGALILVVRGESGLATSAGATLGFLLMSIVILGYSCATVYVRRNMGEYRAFDITSSQMLVAGCVGLLLLAVRLVAGRIAGGAGMLAGVDGWGLSALVYAALSGTFAAIVLYYYNVTRFGATSAAMSQYVVPVVATVGGVLLLGERFTAGMLIGVVLIAAGIGILQQ